MLRIFILSLCVVTVGCVPVGIGVKPTPIYDDTFIARIAAKYASTRDATGKPIDPPYLADVGACTDNKTVVTYSDDQKECLVRVRQEIASDLYLVIDHNYGDYEIAVAARSADWNFALESTSLAASSASSIFRVTSVKTLLSTISSLATGTETSIGKNFLDGKTTDALIGQMRAGRKTVQATIEQGLGDQTYSAYPVGSLLHDMGDYYQAGNLISAINNIVATAGQSQKNSEVDIQSAKVNKGAMQFRTLDAQ